jgi:catechol 2,3-dioxygenase-like lactoylglutathione lyase family enzyme
VKLALDHVVVAARDLDEGVAWCEAQLGITPGPGGKHGLMGTHNRLFSIQSARFPRAYFEIIAIDPAVPAPDRLRWFDLDRPALQAALLAGPQLVHWVARTENIALALAEARAAGVDCGEILQAQRDTDRGTLSWRITVRRDGRRLMRGAMPTLIEWSGAHPVDAMPASGVELEQLVLAGCPSAIAAGLPAAVETVPPTLPPLVAASTTGAHAGARVAVPIALTLRTPRGQVRLEALASEV